MNNTRFCPKKRTAIDGCVWWCIFDNQRNEWSKYIFHFGKFKTRKAAQLVVDQTVSKIERK